jgi:hypothetical protein
VWTNTSATGKALLHVCVYPKPMLSPLPKPISLGRNNACRAYVGYMQKHGHPGLEASSSGFVVHKLDAWVTGPSCCLVQGIAEFKCPYTKLDVTPKEACADASFCCVLVNGRISYCHQVQLQLYVASDLCHCVIFATKGVAVEWDSVWRQQNCCSARQLLF